MGGVEFLFRGSDRLGPRVSGNSSNSVNLNPLPYGQSSGHGQLDNCSFLAPIRRAPKDGNIEDL